ncbi:uncharacterized protein LOC112043604 isoform X1 [Bicyclus anynana]|uniref:Uncharacterized protein LOC112043604 isoform X1 n=1 Tax=Bicyclus anynana TaxID=110368 RepID=A0A6J1MPS7_BICAN|nr:uncharacterized protein LOC112043604 isoform X1 [Bicyclus anynana]XP_023934887.2 uncharacterized protein LOC112043604 isoform X1 [Bicyclus anynana]
MMARDIVRATTTNKIEKSVDQQVISIVKTVLERCKKEKSNNLLQVPLEDCYERVSFYTGLPKMFIYHVVDDNPYTEDNFDDDHHVILMKCINEFLIEQKNLKIPNLHLEFLRSSKQFNADKKYTPDLKTFESKIYSLGYTYKKNLKGPPLILIENAKNRFERFKYLTKIKNYREMGRQIYYVDEKNIVTHLPFKSPSETHNASKKECMIFFHLISKDGYENGIYIAQDKDTSLEDIFKKWMFDIVLHSIKPGSVIVMANNFIHGLQPAKSITRYHSKKRMLQWLKENDIPCDSSMNKPTLYELIERCTINNKDYDIDRVFKVHGHQVLRLPVNFPSLSPTYFLWKFVNMNRYLLNDPTVKQTNPEKCLESLRNRLLNYIMNIDQEWSSFYYQTCTMEYRILTVDSLTEELLENNCELDERSLCEFPASFDINDFLDKPQ